LETIVALDLVQLPYNVLDRRFEQSGCLGRLKSRGTEVHVRSVFLQGLLLSTQDNMPPMFARWSTIWTQWFTWIQEQGLRPLEAALGFVLRNPAVDVVVVGVESAAQLRQIMLNARPLPEEVPTELATGDLSLINPVNWKKS